MIQHPKEQLLKKEDIDQLEFRVSIALDPKEGKVYIGTTTGSFEENTVKILCEGIIRCMQNYYYSPKRMQNELDDIKKYIWNGILDQYPNYKGRLIKKKK